MKSMTYRLDIVLQFTKKGKQVTIIIITIIIFSQYRHVEDKTVAPQVKNIVSPIK